MFSLKRFLVEKLRVWNSEYDDVHSEVVRSMPDQLGINSFNGCRENAFRFSLHSAQGGWVVEVNRYDRHKGDNETNLYILHDQSDIGAELGKIVSVESLRR